MRLLILTALLLIVLLPICGQSTQDVTPKIVWTFELPTKQPITSSPLIESNSVYIGGWDSTFYSLDARNGKVLWKLRTGGPIKSLASIQDESLLFYSGDGALYCVNKSTGSINWKFQTLTGFMGDRSYDLADPFHSNPVIHGGVVFQGSSDGAMYAIDLSSGRQLWKFQTQDIVHTTPVIDYDKILFGSFDGYLYCLSSITGDLVWKFKSTGNRFFPKGEMMGDPVVANGLVYIGSRDYNLYAIDFNNGYCHWTKSFPGGWALDLEIRESILYVGTSDDKAIFAYDAATGKQLWKQDVKFNIIKGMKLIDGNVLGGTLMGKLYCIDAKTGKPNWTFNTKGYQSNHLKYFKEDDTFRDDVFQIVKTPQDALSAYIKLGGIYNAPTANESKFFFASYEGIVYCIETGTQKK